MNTAIKTGKVTAPGIDKIYSMNSHLGSHVTQVLFLLFNKFLDAGRLPKVEKMQIYNLSQRLEQIRLFVLYHSFPASVDPWKGTF